ncbi:MAG: hypothetical protein Q8941_15360 [Bacteroidota bacterium]|nr:hypothetical protein [Bacteroidota bacterium]
MRQVLCILSILLTLSACKKNNNNSSPVANKLPGHYSGTFNRTGMDTANVSFIFSDSTFSGTGGPLNYPAICSGHYHQNGESLVVTDTCSWTANFDWTLIFNGNYSIHFINENKVRIWRTTGLTTDEYLLNRLTR